jgi:hypothetical protein
MKRYLLLLLLCSLFLFCVFGADSKVSAAPVAEWSAQQVQKDQQERHLTRDYLWDTNEWGRSQRSNAISDEDNNPTFSSSYVERQSSHLWKVSERVMLYLKNLNIYKQYYTFLQRKPGHETTAYNSCAPSNYCVVAMRHILR